MSTTSHTLAPVNEDQILLERFVQERSSDAFTQLVQRHVGVVYAHARRVMGDSGLAEDVTQAVFLLLAEKAGKLNPKVPLVGWLYTVTHFTCANARRSEVRRRRIEEEVARMPGLSPEPARSSDVEIHLDRILQQLPAYEREAILLRYVHDYSPAEIAALTHTTEAAAKKRLVRALRKIRERFAAAGVTVPAGFVPAPFFVGLTIPAHLAATSVATALAPSSAIAPGIVELARGGIHMLIAAKMKLVAVVVVILGIVVGVGGILAGQSFSKGQGAMVVQAAPIVAVVPAASAPVITAVAASMPATSPGMISGVVVDAGGKVVGGAFVSLIDRDGSPKVPTIVASVRSAPDGSFSLKDQPELAKTPDVGVQIVADLPGVGMCEPVDWRNITHPIALRFSPSMDVHFPLLDPAGKPPLNISVYLKSVWFPSAGDDFPFRHIFEFPREISQRWLRQTDAKGVATISGIPRRSMLKIDTDDGRFAQIDPRLQITVNSEPSMLVQAIQLLSPCTVSGTLTFADTHLPVANVEITVTNPYTSSNSGYGVGTTDATGHFMVGRLAAGKYVVIGKVSAFPDYAMAAATLMTSPDSPANATMLLAHGGILSGTVRDKVTGKAFPGLIIGLHGPAHPKEIGPVDFATTDINGRYSIHVPPGEQFIYLAQNPPEGYQTPDANPSHVISVMVTDGQTVTYNFDLVADSSQSISGTVVDENDAPVANAQVLCVLPQAHNVHPDGSKTVVADASGHFVVPGFKGSAILRARAGALATLKATTVKFADDEIILRVSPNATFSVVVRATDTDGIAVPNVMVSAVAISGNFGSGGLPMPLNADGTVRYDLLSKDMENFVTASAPGYLDAQKDLKSPGGNELTVRLVLKKADTPISGTVRDAAGKGVANVEMGIIEDIHNPSAKTDANGHYQFLVPEGMKTAVYIRAAGGGALNGEKDAEAGETDVDFVMPEGVGK